MMCVLHSRWGSSAPEARDGSAETEAGFNSMNHVVARLLTDLTASMRFAGDLNVDLNEITTNLVPFSRLHYLLSSLSPFPAPPETRSRWGRASISGTGAHEARPRRMNLMFSEAFSSAHQLLQAEPRFVEGYVDSTISEVQGQESHFVHPAVIHLLKIISSQEIEVPGVRLAGEGGRGRVRRQHQHSAS